MSSVCLPLWQNTFSIQEINHIQYNTSRKATPPRAAFFHTLTSTFPPCGNNLPSIGKQLFATPSLFANFATRTILSATTQKLNFMERTYVFNSDGNSCGARYDINAMLPGLMNRGIDPGVLALMNGNGGFGGQNGIWGVIYLAIVASIFGWNNGGFGGFGGRGGNGLPAELAGNAGRELLMQAIQGNASAINQIASTLNCSSQQIESALCNIQNSVGLTGTQIINAIQSGNNSVLNQLSSCCCNMLQSIERQGYESRLATCEQTHTLVDTANNNALSLRDGATANTNAILAKLDAMQNQAQQDKIASLTTQLAAAQSEISQRNQNATILNAVGQQIAPLAAGLQALQSDVDGIKCKLPNTVPVQWPNIIGVNTDLYKAAAVGAAAGQYAGYGCGCGYNAGFWG